MRSQLLLIPPALCVLAQPAWSTTYYLTGEEAQQLLFPGATFTDMSRDLTDKEVAEIRAVAGVAINDPRLRMWKASTGGWFFVDQSQSIDTTYTVAVGLDAKGVVIGIEIMDCITDYCRIRLPEWRAQFVGKKLGDLRGEEEIENISGSTRNVVQITEGVRKILTIFDRLVRTPPRKPRPQAR